MPGRRAPNTGQCFFSEAKQQFVIRAQNPHTGAWKERSRKEWRTQRQAQDALEALRVELATLPQTHQKQTDQSVRDFLTQWLADKAVQVRPRTLRAYKDHAALWAKEIGHIPLAHLEARHIQAAITDMITPAPASVLDRAYAPSTVHRARSMLMTALGDAEAFDLIARNPVRRTRPPRAEARTPAPLDIEEARRILASVRGTRLAAPVTLALYYGLRAGEVCGLQWRHVGEATIRIEGQLAEDGKGIAPTKTPRSMRVLPLIAPVVAALADQREVIDAHRQRAGRRWAEGDAIAIRVNGGPMTRQDLYRLWRRHSDAAGLVRRTYHDLRHGTVSLLAELGVDEQTRMLIVGHSQVASHRGYRHLSERAVEDALRRLTEALGE